MLYRLSYASVLRREIVYHNPPAPRCKGFPHAAHGAPGVLGSRERTTSAALRCFSSYRELFVSGKRLCRKVRCNGVFSLVGADPASSCGVVGSTGLPVTLCAAGPIRSRPA
jgi:hypothetical protein